MLASKACVLPFNSVQNQMKCLYQIARLMSSSPLTETEPKTKGQMLAHQHQLRRIPVPPLRLMLEKYLRFLRPKLAVDQYERTEKIVQNFLKPGGNGEKLHKLLLQRAQMKEDWLTDVWLQIDHLNFRKPVTGYYSPTVAYSQRNFQTKNDQLNFAASVISGLLDFKALVDEQLLTPETMHGQPLDMNPYLKIFSTCRVPEYVCDSQVFHGLSENPPRHIVIVHNNHFFKMDAYDANGNPLNNDQLLTLLQIAVGQSEQTAPAVGSLTALNRDKWKAAYDCLRKDEINNKAINSIEEAMFVICLDKKIPDLSTNKYTHNLCHVAHGAGASWNGGNRWFDKNLQIMISEDGVFGMVNEHSPVDGIPLCRTMNHVLDYLKKPSNVTMSQQINPMLVEELVFNLSKETLKDIEEAKEEMEGIVKSLDFFCLPFLDFGKNFFKAKQISPDSFVQMAIYLTYYRLYGIKGTQFEANSLRKFIHGRLGYIRVTTPEAMHFCATMLDSKASHSDKKNSLKSAIQAHLDEIKQVSNGYGMDHYLYSLRQIARENNFPTPEIFDDVYEENIQFTIMSSTTVASEPSFAAFGPFEKDAYSVAYIFYPESMHFSISANNECPSTSAEAFGAALEMSLKELHDLMA